MLDREVLLRLYDRLFEAYGPQGWWPAETAFEMMVGAVLTQNTAWTNVEKAIYRLKQGNNLTLSTLTGLKLEELSQLIRPSGYFNIKAQRLKNLCQWLNEQGGIDALKSLATEELRPALLSVNGIGPETADDILLYAFARPVFVIDTYTRHLLKKQRLIKGNEDYETLRQCFEVALDPEPVLFNEYHALIVRHAKEKCTNIEACKHCYIEAPLI